MKKTNVKSVNDLGTFETAIGGASDEMKALARGLRALVAEVMPGVTEVPWERQKVIGYGVGPKKMTEHFCYISPAKNHVNLGFYYGTQLNDPKGLLEGTGKVLRHVKVRNIEELKSPALKKLLVQASRHLPKLKDARKTL